MRPPSLPMPQAAAAMQQRPNAGRTTRKSAPGAPTNRPAGKTTSTHSNSPTHKTARRKGASVGSAADQPDIGVDFAAMLAQTVAQPGVAASATTPATATGAADTTRGADTGADPAASATALLRPWAALTSALTPSAADGTEVKAGAPGAADAVNASSTATEAAMAPTTAQAPVASELDATAGSGAAPISVPSDLLSADQTITAQAADAAPVVHAADAREALHRAQPSAAGASDTGGKIGTAGATSTDSPDVGSAATSSADAARTGAEQSAGDESPTGQPHPDLAGNAIAAGLTSSVTGTADRVSDAPMPVHSVAPTLAQVAQSLRTSGDGTSRLVIRLDPVELGPVLVTLRTRGGAVDISVRADNAGGAAAVADQRAHIQQVLAEHGLDLSSFSVSGGESSGGAGSSTSDSGTSDSSADGSQNGDGGADVNSDPNAASYADVQAQASGADGQAGDRRAFAAPSENPGATRNVSSTASTDDMGTPAVRTVRREGTWL